jgi:hypothetical protein
MDRSHLSKRQQGGGRRFSTFARGIPYFRIGIQRKKRWAHCIDISPEKDSSKASVAFVTKSDAPDLERCELRCRSLELLARGVNHWIIVDRRDRSAFQPLETAGTRIVTTEELLPRRVRRLVIPRTEKNVWLAAGTPPMRARSWPKRTRSSTPTPTSS